MLLFTFFSVAFKIVRFHNVFIVVVVIVNTMKIVYVLTIANVSNSFKKGSSGPKRVQTKWRVSWIVWKWWDIIYQQPLLQTSSHEIFRYLHLLVWANVICTKLSKWKKNHLEFEESIFDFQRKTKQSTEKPTQTSDILNES